MGMYDPDKRELRKNREKEEEDVTSCEISEIMAKDHADFLADWTRFVAKEVFEHGFKHGVKSVTKTKEGK